jgi:hypothetical protein
LTCSSDEHIEERTTKNSPSSRRLAGSLKAMQASGSTGVGRASTYLKTLFSLVSGALCVLGVLSVLTGCAKVGDPLPPIVNVPDPVRDLQLIQVGSENVELVFAVADDAVREVEVYRECGQEVSAESEPFARLEVADLGLGNQEGTRVFRDSISGVTGLCTYVVRLRGSSRHWSVRSDSVSTVDAALAQAPTNLRAKVMEDRIELTWDPPEQNVDGTEPATLSGYLVNSRHRSSEARHVIREFGFGKSLTYVVQSVSREGNPLVLSLPSASLTVEPKDVFPPEAPAKLMAVAVEDAVQLIWDANTESDLAGYVVYRRLTGGNFERVATLVTVNRFLDETAPSGTPLQYAVSALDNADNESPYSEVTDITVNP